jgi:hypothetical protein
MLAPEASPPARVQERRRGKLTSSKLGLVDQGEIAALIRSAAGGARAACKSGLPERLA